MNWDWQAMQAVSKIDLCAYPDWAALRPMSELEFEKACRGPLPPVAGEYAWGTTDLVLAANIIPGGIPIGANETFVNCGIPGCCNYGVPPGLPAPPYNYAIRCGFMGSCIPPPTTRLQMSAGYYGATELTGNLIERYFRVSEGPDAAMLQWGDGLLDMTGFANQGWPIDRLGVRGGGIFAFAEIGQVSDRTHIYNNTNLRFMNLSGRGAR
jgi:hypothetical protein